VGTLAPVLGEHAAPVASALVRELRAIAGHRNGAASGEGSTIGDAMLRVRRRLLAKGQLSALCITSFGDADWQLGGSQGGG
jgi:hypothetical protein